MERFERETRWADGAALGVQPTFLKKDVNELDFPDETFDAIVLRSVSWTLQWPERVYTEFKRLLRPGGWDETVLPSLGFTILGERIYRPQALLKYGVAKGYYTEFFVAAIRD